MADINDLKNRTVSHGTLNPDHLIPAFCDVLKEYAPDKYAEFIKGYPELDDWEDFLEADWRIISDDTKMNASDELFGLLNDIAPEGTMFSSTEGDGSDFGFWTVEEKKEESKDITTLTDLKKFILSKNDNSVVFGVNSTGDLYFVDSVNGKEVPASADSLAVAEDDSDEHGKRIGNQGTGYFVVWKNGKRPIYMTAQQIYDELLKIARSWTVEEKKSEAKGDNWIACYFCKDKYTGDEYAVLPTTREFYAGHGGSGWTLDCFDEKGNWDKQSYSYFVTTCEPIEQPEQSSVYKAVKKKMKRDIVILTRTDFYDIVDGEHPQNTLKSIMANRENKSEAKGNNWVAYYFCEDPQGLEWAVLPHAINGIGNASCVNARGGNDTIGIEYVLDKCSPIKDVKGSDIYGKVKELEDRDIVALTRDEAERIVLADDHLKELKSVVAPKDEAADSRRVDDYANMRFFDPEEFVKYVRKAYGKDGGYVSIDSVVPVSVLNKAYRMSQKNGYSKLESKNESLTLKQKELKDMARYGEAEDITTISDAEAKELKKKGIETVGVSRGTYGMNGALLRDREGNKYVITARSSNLFYFV